ncbi:MAG: TonB-dependent receptor, partial [Cyclobacteriaceae bacterium]|nr:TonB-dependent receptor [Cyclobacteriaceae bacterium]
MGYEEKTLSNIVVNSGKEVVLKIEIVEAVMGLEEVVIIADDLPKNEALNEMSIVSTRTFSVEETTRFAGTLNDPARMAANYAGVNASPVGNNDIIVRGNSPKGMLWRLEGIEIPNPNHFAGEGATGGPINALNSSVLANSDFLTGAFSPEYGNALSGIFDMKLRQGNNENREYDFSAGVIGMDMTMEGPFVKGKKASYLINGRYSSLEILDNAGIVDFGGVPKYKDLSFKFHFPTKNAGAFSLFGLVGKSNILLDSTTLREIDQADIGFLSESKAHLGVVGLNHIYFINSNTYTESFLSMASNGMDGTFQISNGNLVEYGSYDIQNKRALRTGAALHKKVNVKNKTQAGLIYSHQAFTFDQQYKINDTLFTAIDEKNSAGLAEAYFSWKHRVNDKLTLVNGLHSTFFTLNNTYAIEPRAALQWQMKPGRTINVGAGIHSKPQVLPGYFVNIENASGTIESPNRDLELTKALHFVTGYSMMLGTDTHFKLDLYYQHLYDVPIAADPNSTESMLNSIDSYDEVAFVSEGT